MTKMQGGTHAAHKSFCTYGEMFKRNTFTKTQQQKIRASPFAIIGLGGTGGAIFENLLRMGAERIIVFDHDRVEGSNFNRQFLATAGTLDKRKTDAAISRAREINPAAEVTAYEEFLVDDDAKLAGVRVIIDGSDNVKTKQAVAATARRMKAPYVFCSAAGTRGMVSVFLRYKFENAFQINRKGILGGQGEGRKIGIEETEDFEKMAERLGKLGASTQGKADATDARNELRRVICPAASLAGTIAAAQAVNVLIGKPYVKAPEAICFDIQREEMFWRARLG